MKDNKDLSLKKRAKRKYLNYPVLSHLLALNSPNRKRYETTLSCSSVITVENGKTSSRYCKRVWCNICNPIRVAVRLNKYEPLLKRINQLHLTTLTIPNVRIKDLRQSIKSLRGVITTFRDKQRKSKQEFKGVYNIEITYNHTSRTYHPHLHIIHSSLEFIPTINEAGKQVMTNQLIEYWLIKFPQSKMLAQHTTVCEQLIEGFKYSSKSIFSVTINGKKQTIIPAKSLDEMYRSIHNIKMFGAFGLGKIEEEKSDEQIFDELQAQTTEKISGQYIWSVHDWFNRLNIDKDTGEVITAITEDSELMVVPLSEYKPTERVITLYNKLLKNEHYESETESTNCND